MIFKGKALSARKCSAGILPAAAGGDAPKTAAETAALPKR
jgi:hypothetical protein